ncbi:MAG: hypothetical protein JRG95_14200 [Deltaproteobacteria bacterium]|nr:hypothetical protein [Deltaproteobacteria bacterium]
MFPMVSHAGEWQKLEGAEELKAFVSGATAEITLRPGVVARGEYRPDGTAKIEAWNEVFPRTWEIRGDDQVCYSSDTDTNCFFLEQSQSNPEEFRSRNVETGEVTQFRLAESSGTYTRQSTPDDEGGLGAPSAEEIAAELSNPNTALGSMNLNFDYIGFEGDLPGSDDRTAYRMTFQPSLPYPLTETMNVFFRPSIPMIFEQDVPREGGGFSSKGVDLGDIGFDASIAKTFGNGLVLVGGAVGTLPTATDDALGLDQWLLGPEAAVAMVRPWGVMGVLVTHQWDIAGENDFSTSITGGQYFYTFNLGDGWQINGSPTFSYNHKADSDNAWTFPLAVGLSKTTIIAGRPWKFSLQYWHYLESPDVFGPEHQIRFTISPVVKLPW